MICSKGRCRAVQGGCTICTSASIISGAGRCRRCRHTSGSAVALLFALQFVLVLVYIYDRCGQSKKLMVLTHKRFLLASSLMLRTGSAALVLPGALPSNSLAKKPSRIRA